MEPISQKPQPESAARPVTILEQRLEIKWVSALQNCSVEPSRGAAVFQDLMQRYSEPDRCYHNAEHLETMLRFLTEHETALEAPSLVTLAVFFHDAIYDSKAKDNEERSADLAKIQLGLLGLSAEDCELVIALIQSTKKHQLLVDGPDNKLFLDADLLILSSPQADYMHYADAIRKEYAWVPDDEYRTGRSAVLKTFLNRSSIYFSDALGVEAEHRAINNLELEIELLSSAVDTP